MGILFSACTPKRSLKVLVKSGKKLRNADGPFGNGSDAYVTLRLLDNGGKTIGGPFQTTVKSEGANPVWNEEFVFHDLQSPGAYTLRINVLDKDEFLGIKAFDKFDRDDVLGKVDFHLGTLENTNEYQDRELIIVDGYVSDSTLRVGFHTGGQWGK